MKGSRRELKPMTENELDTLLGLLNVSDRRLSRTQKNALHHLLFQYRMLSVDKMKSELIEMEINDIG